jgi:hypothetical protein
MLPTIQLNNQLRLKTGKIHDYDQRHLAAKLIQRSDDL